MVTASKPKGKHDSKEIPIVVSSFRSKNIDNFHEHVSHVVRTFGKRCGLSHYLCAVVTCGILRFGVELLLSRGSGVFVVQNSRFVLSLA